MSRKPTIKLSYPDASTLAMQLTDAMIRRAPGKRVLATTSEDKAGDGEGSLLDGLNSVRTSTGVEMTLTLEPNSMDYALQQLIRPNLTADEKKRILGDSASGDDLLPGSAPAEDQTAPDQEKQIEITEPGFSYMTYALFGLILATIELLKKTKRDSPVNSLLLYLDLAKQHLEKNKNEIEHYFLDALHVGWARAYISPQKEENARALVDQITEKLYNQDRINPDSDPSWDDVEKEAREIGKHKSDETDKTDDSEPGLLDDLDDGSDGMASAEEVMGHDE